MNFPPFPCFILLSLLSTIQFLAILLSTDQLHSFPPPQYPFHTIAPLLFVTVYLLSILDNHGHPANADPFLLRLLGRYPRGARNQGRDVVSILQALHPTVFWYFTGETPESFEAIVRRVGDNVARPRHTPRYPRTNRRRACILDVPNRVLLAMIWLRQYPKLHVLAGLFMISKSTVQEELYHVIPILFLHYRGYISWHSVRRWQTFLDTFPRFPNAVGAIDATIHRIQRPSGARQAEFYRADKKCHFMSTQIVIDPDGLIVLLVAGFPGRLNDAGTYNRLPAIGHGGARPLPRRGRLLADGGYPNRIPLITPRRIARNRRQQEANRALRSIRVRVEHAMSRMKVYASTTAVFRHMRPFQPVVVATCGMLTNRRRRIFQLV